MLWISFFLKELFSFARILRLLFSFCQRVEGQFKLRLSFPGSWTTVFRNSVTSKLYRENYGCLTGSDWISQSDIFNSLTPSTYVCDLYWKQHLIYVIKLICSLTGLGRGSLSQPSWCHYKDKSTQKSPASCSGNPLWRCTANAPAGWWNLRMVSNQKKLGRGQEGIPP